MAKSPSVADCTKRGNGRYPFGQSLYLIVRGGSALWEYQYRQDKRLRTRSYGSAVSRYGEPPVTLTQARAMRAADWLERRGQRQQVRQTATAFKLFDVARDEYLSKHSAEWQPEQLDKLTRMLAKHTATLEGQRVDRITKEQMADLLRPIWKGPGSHTGNRVRGMVEKILRYAGIENNPARWEVLADELSNKIVRSQNRASLPYADVPALMRELAALDTAQARAARFIILTAARQDEALEATWKEIDLVNKVWSIPGGEREAGGRMKMKDPHKVALTDEAIACLGPCRGDGALVFPSKLGGRLSQQTVRDLVQGLRPGVTVHGFRASMATWAQEQDKGRKYQEPVILAALAKYKGDLNTRAYLRSKLYEPRKELMEEWSIFAAGNPSVSIAS